MTRKGDILPTSDGFIRVINPDWPMGDEPYCERVPEDEVQVAVLNQACLEYKESVQ